MKSLSKRQQKRLTEGKPIYTHDCRGCKFLGSAIFDGECEGLVDMYYHGNGGLGFSDESENTIVVRRSSEPSNYGSGMIFAFTKLSRENPYFYALESAVRQGFIKDFSVEKIGLFEDVRKTARNIINLLKKQVGIERKRGWFEDDLSKVLDALKENPKLLESSQYLVVQDRHACPVYAYTSSQRQAEAIKENWDEHHGHCPDHRHFSKIWTMTDWIIRWGKTPEQMFGTDEDEN